MKILLIPAFFLFGIAAAYTQKPAKLSGHIQNPTGETVYLYTVKFENGRRSTVYLDSAMIEGDGKFEMTAALDSTVSVTFSDGNEQMAILLSPGDQQHVQLNTRYFDETMRFSGKGSDKNNAVVALYLIDEAFQTNFFSLADSDDADTTVLFGNYDKHSEKMAELVRDYMTLLPDFESHGQQMLETETMKKKQIRSFVANQIEFKKHLKSIVGQPAIDFEGVDLNGEKIRLSDFKGKMIVVDFWATWCGPCKAEFPAYKELEAEFGEEVHFVSVGAFCDQTGWKKMAEEEGFHNNIYLSKEAEKQISDYRVNFIPRYLVIDETFHLIDADAPRPSSGELQGYWQK